LAAGGLCSVVSSISVMTESWSFLEEITARLKEVTIKVIAAPVVSLVRKLPAPLLPNIA